MHASAGPEQAEGRTGGRDAEAASTSAHSAPPRKRADHRFGQYELKFLISESAALQVMDWARQHMARDPVAQCDEREMYHVHTVYLDTPALGVFGRAGALRTRKYRLRRYGNEDTIWLERKAKVHGRVKKRRTPVSEPEVAHLLGDDVSHHWSGHWFRRRVKLRQLQPVCSVTYERFARVGLTPEGPIRMTLDRAVGGQGLAAEGMSQQPTASWDVPRSSLAGLERLNGLCILELKYPTTLPALFKGIMSDFTLAPLKVSKFRTCMETWVVGESHSTAEDAASAEALADPSRAVA